MPRIWEWTLANGMHVWFRRSEGDAGRFILRAIADGGWRGMPGGAPAALAADRLSGALLASETRVETEGRVDDIGEVLRELAEWLAGRVPAMVDPGTVMQWLPQRLDEAADGATTIVYHSIVEEYVPAGELAAFHSTMEEAGARSTARRPLGWVRLEQQPGQKRHQLTLRLWPGGEERVLAVSGAHGTNVRAFVA